MAYCVYRHEVYENHARDISMVLMVQFAIDLFKILEADGKIGTINPVEV